MTHQGGEAEHPSNTMYAYRESLALGADMLELDVQPTEDGHLVALHDASLQRTTGRQASVYDLTLAEVQQLDAAYNFVPGKGTDPAAADHPLRGVRTGAKPTPLGYTRADFRIPSLEELLRAFPAVPINIEIKGRSDSDTKSFLDNADRLVALLRRVPHDKLIVVSFNQQAVDRFHAQMPTVGVAPGILGVAQFYATGIAPAGTVALQVPPSFSGVPIMSPQFVARAHAGGYAVHAWFSGQEESPRVYDAMLDMGADGLMPAKPRALETVLCARKAPRPAGNPNHCFGGAEEARLRCAAHVLRAGRVRVRGTVPLVLRRFGPLNVACGGAVAIRARRSAGARYGGARFHFPYGVSDVRVSVRLSAAARRRSRRGLTATAGARVDGQHVTRHRRVTLRR